MTEWIMTQSGAVRKSEVALIVPQILQNKKVNVLLITKERINMVLYSEIADYYTALAVIDNTLTAFDENHVPKIDLEKLQNEEPEQEEEPIIEIRPPEPEPPKPVEKKPQPSPAPAPTPISIPKKSEDEAE